MAKFLQDTIEETALQRTGASGDSVHEFGVFMQKVRYVPPNCLFASRNLSFTCSELIRISKFRGGDGGGA